MRTTLGLAALFVLHVMADLSYPDDAPVEVDLQTAYFEFVVTAACLGGLFLLRRRPGASTKWFRLGLALPALSSGVAIVYFGRYAADERWEAAVVRLTVLTWRVGVPAFAPALAIQHGVRGLRSAAPVLAYGAVAAHAAGLYGRALGDKFISGSCLVAASLASIETRLRRGDFLAAAGVALNLALFGSILYAGASEGVYLPFGLQLDAGDCVHAAEATALLSAAVHAATFPESDASIK